MIIRQKSINYVIETNSQVKYKSSSFHNCHHDRNYKRNVGISTKWRGSVFFRMSSGGKLTPLNSMVGLFETEIDADGNFSEKAWE